MLLLLLLLPVAAGIYDAVKSGLAKIKNIGKKEDFD
jgi:hypothetical protein